MTAPARAPIVLFVYNRPEHTRRTLISLAGNPEAQESELYVYADGAPAGASPELLAAIQQTRAVVHAEAWCGSVSLVERPENWGLARNIHAGVSAQVERAGRVIVLEDDLELSPAFLGYMNAALATYADEPRVMQVAGYLPDLPGTTPETFFLRTTTSWGWATWARAWQHYQADAASLLAQLENTDQLRAFNLDGACDYAEQLRLNATGQLRTWAILWYASVFLGGGLVLYPGRPLVRNIGHDASGTNSGREAHFANTLSDEPVAVAPQPLVVNAAIHAAMWKKYAGPRLHRLWRFLRRAF